MQDLKFQESYVIKYILKRNVNIKGSMGDDDWTSEIKFCEAYFD